MELRTHSYDSIEQETPFTRTTTGLPQNVTGVVTGSGRDRNKLNLEEREILLSTAILSTPKSPKFGGGLDVDQSLHHIDACIKPPLHFGSPTMG